MSKKPTKRKQGDSLGLEVDVGEPELDEDGYEVGPPKVNIGASSTVLADITGTSNDDLQNTLARQLLTCLPRRLQRHKSSIKGAFAMLRGINPQDELEGALAVQMVGIHFASLEMMNRAMLDEQTVEGVTENTNRAVKLTRTFTAQIEALQRYRTKGQQTIQVQHVQVNDGGKAIVGNIKTGGGNG